MKKILSHLFFFLLCFHLHAQDSLKNFKATRIISPPKIDGILDDEAWKSSEVISDFIQNTPNEGKQPAQKTEVRILYDDFAIYVNAMMYDTAPDSILHELGNRDDDNLNAEKFRFVVDPYDTRHDAYDFGVYSSGVQLDSRISDYTYNGVWESAVKINKNGWSVEMKIPYSAIRFPNTKEQKWAVQFSRDIRRTREFDQWALTPNGQANPQKYWGALIGISDIKPPLRLSLSPYLSSYYATSPEYNADGSYNYAHGFSYNYGADVKYGIDDRFTLDMTLLPDFGQVQSDYKIKNLTYREVTYSEYRPFFNEGTDLFNKDRLFYSRRIGKTPTYFSTVPDSLKSGETILKNPSKTQLINATKISGRTNKGLGIGFLNAVTDNCYATIKDSTGKIRKILTEPLANYNAIVFDQQLKNASNVYFINTNVVRQGKTYRDANVSSAGFSIQNKKNIWAIDGTAALSQLITKSDTTKNYLHDQPGNFYHADIRKISGTWQGSLGYETMSNTYDRSDMGYQSINNYSAMGGDISYNIFKPRKSILRSFNDLNVHYSYNYITKLPTDFGANLSLFVLPKSYNAFFGGGGIAPTSNYDYYEPRVDGRYFRTVQNYYVYMGISSDYRKTFAIDFNGNMWSYLKNNAYNLATSTGFGADIKPRVRINDKLSFIYDFNYSFDPNNLGWSLTDTNGAIIFGTRKLNTFINTLTARYIFKNNLSLSLNARHYWSTGYYLKYYTLQTDGYLADNNSNSYNSNFSYNAFNIDAVFSWQFAPGSLFSIVYKNAIEKSDAVIPTSLSGDFSGTLQSPQTNSISIKVLYYLDYLQVKRKKV
jgi:hypothetical protein